METYETDVPISNRKSKKCSSVGPYIAALGVFTLAGLGYMNNSGKNEQVSDNLNKTQNYLIGSLGNITQRIATNKENINTNRNDIEENQNGIINLRALERAILTDNTFRFDVDGDKKDDDVYILNANIFKKVGNQYMHLGNVGDVTQSLADRYMDGELKDQKDELKRYMQATIPYVDISSEEIDAFFKKYN